MIPVTQTKVVVKNSKGQLVVHGNCYAAAIASILDLPISEVPNVEVLFDMEGKDKWLWDDVMNKWLASKGYKIEDSYLFRVFHENLIADDLTHGDLSYDITEWKEKLTDQYYFAEGLSARDVFHICIYQNGKLIHDPHPTREGLKEVKYLKQLVKLEDSFEHKFKKSEQEFDDKEKYNSQPTPLF